MAAQIGDVRAELLSLMAVKPAAQFGQLDAGATPDTPSDSELATRLTGTEAELRGLKAMVDELRQTRDAQQGQAGRGTRQMVIRWKQGLLRLWIVASVLWIASVWWFRIGYNVFDQFDEAPNGVAVIFSGLVQSPLLPRLNQAPWAFGPPIATLILGYAISWIVLGFRPRKVG